MIPRAAHLVIRLHVICYVIPRAALKSFYVIPRAARYLLCDSQGCTLFVM